METASATRTRSRAAAGGPSKVADCGTGQARLQLADPAAPHSRIDMCGGRNSGRNSGGNSGGNSAGRKSTGSKTDLATRGSSVGK